MVKKIKKKAKSKGRPQQGTSNHAVGMKADSFSFESLAYSEFGGSQRLKRSKYPIKVSVPQINPETADYISDLIDLGCLSTHSGKDHAEREFTKLFDMLADEPLGLDVNMVSSGTAALHLALLVYDIGPGDLVYVPNFTFPATVNVVKLVGATPVLVDVEPGSYVISGETLRAAITESKGLGRPRAVIPVHEFGFPAPMDEVMSIAETHDLIVIEDAACAIGGMFGDQPLGTIGHIGCVSLHPRKIITSAEGGVVVTRDLERGRRIRRLKDHGIERDEQGGISFVEPGYNYKMSDIHAGLLLVQVDWLTDFLEIRDQLALRYDELLAPLVERGFLTLPKRHPGQVWQSYVVTLAPQFSQKSVSTALRAHQIETNAGATVLSTIPHLNEQATSRLTKGVAHSVLHDHTLALPLCQDYDHEIVKEVVEALTEVLSSQA